MTIGKVADSDNVAVGVIAALCHEKQRFQNDCCNLQKIHSLRNILFLTPLNCAGTLHVKVGSCYAHVSPINKLSLAGTMMIFKILSGLLPEHLARAPWALAGISLSLSAEFSGKSPRLPAPGKGRPHLNAYHWNCAWDSHGFLARAPESIPNQIVLKLFWGSFRRGL